MTARLAHIFRHPVKSVGGEALDEVRLTEGQPLPGDRLGAPSGDQRRLGR